MKELLGMCGFEPEEMEIEMPRIKRAFDKLNLNAADMDVGKERLTKYYELDLMGFRKILKVYIREMVNAALAGEEKRKIIYNTMPSLIPFVGRSASIADESVYSGLPEVLLFYIYAGIFDKQTPLLEAAERDGLPPDGAHCGCTKTRLGTQILGLLPKPDLYISNRVFCDEAPKVDEYMKEELGIPFVSIERIQDTNFDELFPQREVDYYGNSIRNAMKVMSELIGKEITDEMMWKAFMEYGMVVQGLQKIFSLSKDSDPIVLSVNTVSYMFALFSSGVSPENVPVLAEALQLLLKETQERVDRGEGYYGKGWPRIGCFPPSLVDPSALHLLKEVGLAVPLMEPMWWCPDSEVMPDLKTNELDPCKVMAMTLPRIPVTASPASRCSAVAKAAKKHNLEGFMLGNLYGCRPGFSDAYMLKDAWKKSTDWPFMALEINLYDSRVHTTEALRTRVESFAEMCRMAKSAKSRATA